MQTRGTNFFLVLAYAYHADDRIRIKRTCYFLENLEVNQHKVANLRSIVRAYSVHYTSITLPPPSLEILTIACLTFCLLLTDGPTLSLPEYKLKVVNICKMHGTGGLEVVVLCAF